MTAFERAVANISDTPGGGMKDWTLEEAVARIEPRKPGQLNVGHFWTGEWRASDTPLSPDETADLEREEEPTEPLEGPGRVRPVYEDDAELGGEG